MLAACARVLTRHPAAQPGCLRRSKRKRGCFLISTLRRPEGLGRRAAAFPGLGLRASPAKTGEEPRPDKGCRCSDDLRWPGRSPPRALRWPCCRAGDFARRCRSDAQGRAEDLRRYRASRLHRLARHGQHAQACGRRLPRQADRGQSPRRARRLDRRPHPLHADRGLSASATPSSTIGRAG